MYIYYVEILYYIQFLHLFSPLPLCSQSLKYFPVLICQHPTPTPPFCQIFFLMNTHYCTQPNGPLNLLSAFSNLLTHPPLPALCSFLSCTICYSHPHLCLFFFTSAIAVCLFLNQSSFSSAFGHHTAIPRKITVSTQLPSWKRNASNSKCRWTVCFESRNYLQH